jgi:hypothetical protein
MGIMNTCTHCRSFDSARGVCLRWKIVQPADGSCESFTAHDGTSFDDLHTRLQQAESFADLLVARLEACTKERDELRAKVDHQRMALADLLRKNQAARGGLQNQGSK